MKSQHEHSKLNHHDISQWFSGTIVRHVPTQLLIYLDAVHHCSDIDPEHRPDDLKGNYLGRVHYSGNSLGKYVDMDDVEAWVPQEFYLNDFMQVAPFITRRDVRIWSHSFRTKSYNWVFPNQMEASVLGLSNGLDISSSFMTALQHSKYYSYEEARTRLNDNKALACAFSPRYMMHRPLFSEHDILCYKGHVVGTAKEDHVLLSDVASFLAEDLSQFVPVEVHSYA